MTNRWVTAWSVLVVLVVTGITSAALTWSSYTASTNIIERAKTRELQGVATLIQNDIQEQSNAAAARASLIVSMPAVQDAFRNDNRAELIRVLQPAFAIQKQQYSVREGHFALPPALSYLRLETQNAPREDLSAFREMILTTNRKQQAQKGIEIGRSGLSIRGMEQVKDATGHIGAFEIGISFSLVLENTKKNTGFEAGVFVDEKLMSSIATLLPKPDLERIVAGFRNVESTNWRVIRSMITPDLMAKATDVVFKLKPVEGVDYGMVIVPVLDFKGVQIGAIVAARSFEEYQTQLRAAFVRSVGLGMLQAVLVAGTMLMLIRGLFLRRKEQASLPNVKDFTGV